MLMRWKDVLMSDSAEIENPLAARLDHRDHTEPCRPTLSASSGFNFYKIIIKASFHVISMQLFLAS